MQDIKIHSILPNDPSDEYKDFKHKYVIMKRYTDPDTLDEDFTCVIAAEQERAFIHSFQTAVKILGGNFKAFLND